MHRWSSTSVEWSSVRLYRWKCHQTTWKIHIQSRITPQIYFVTTFFLNKLLMWYKFGTAHQGFHILDQRNAQSCKFGQNPWSRDLIPSLWISIMSSPKSRVMLWWYVQRHKSVWSLTACTSRRMSVTVALVLEGVAILNFVTRDECVCVCVCSSRC